MIEELRKQIDDSDYWDARVIALDCHYFGDEVKLVYEDEDKDNGKMTYHFKECYKVKIEHLIDYPKNIPSKELKPAQIPYFMQDVELNELTLGNKKYLEFKIDMYPIDLYIVCKHLTIY